MNKNYKKVGRIGTDNFRCERELSPEEKEAAKGFRAAIRPEILEAWEEMNKDKCSNCGGLLGNYQLSEDLKFIKEMPMFFLNECRCNKTDLILSQFEKDIEEIKEITKTVNVKGKDLPSLF